MLVVRAIVFQKPQYCVELLFLTTSILRPFTSAQTNVSVPNAVNRPLTLLRGRRWSVLVIRKNHQREIFRRCGWLHDLRALAGLVRQMEDEVLGMREGNSPRSVLDV